MLFSSSATVDQTEHAQGDADRARGAPPLRELELLVCQFESLLWSTEALQGERGVRPPRRQRGILDAQRVGEGSGGAELRQRLLWRTGLERDKPADAKEVEKVASLCHCGWLLDQPLRLGQLTALEEEFSQIASPVGLQRGCVLERHALDRLEILFRAPQISDIRAQLRPEEIQNRERQRIAAGLRERDRHLMAARGLLDLAGERQGMEEVRGDEADARIVNRALPGPPRVIHRTLPRSSTPGLLRGPGRQQDARSGAGTDGVVRRGGELVGEERVELGVVLSG